MEVRRYGMFRDDDAQIPNLVDLQTLAYDRFLQAGVTALSRENRGLEAIIREIFPIQSYNKQLSLSYLGYELGRPRYGPDECRKLRLTYGMPFKIRVRLEKEEPIEEEVYLGEIPIMIGGGEFIINGAERVIVSQLHRSPGVDFDLESQTGERKLHSCWIIPERGSWIEIAVTKKNSVMVRIDKSGKIPATAFLRACSESYSTNEDIIRRFYQIEKLPLSGRGFSEKAKGRYLVGDIVDGETGEIVAYGGSEITENLLDLLVKSELKHVEVVGEKEDLLIINTLVEDTTKSHEEALLRIYARLRPGNPPNVEKAAELFREKFFDAARYRLGRVGRFRINRKFHQQIPETEMTLNSEDIVHAILYLFKLRKGEGELDDIDNLGNRRVRTIDELGGDEFRKGFLKLRRTIQERMNLDQPEDMTPRSLINSKTVSSAIEYFFGRGELSQVVDQPNPLAQLTHERRLSALGPGGLNRKRAGFEVRDVHISHYGRICPIETPEGTNIGLISSLAIYSGVDSYGFLTTPYRRVKDGKVTEEIVRLRADEEFELVLAPADTERDEHGHIKGPEQLARFRGEFTHFTPKSIQFLDVSPKQMVGVSASLVPFLEHDDANRALMGSNMQRQAVPLLVTESPIVGTGMESVVARNSSMVICARREGVVTRATAREIEVEGEVYPLRKFFGLNERTCLNQRPCVKEGERVEAGQVIADGPATSGGELALGKNVQVAFMTWDGYNFEDAIIVSENLVQQDKFTSIHIDEFEIEIRETKLGREEFTRDIPNVSERALRNLDEYGIVRVGTYVRPGDVLVGKVAPKSKSELSPEEKLLHAIFGRAGEDVKNDSLVVCPGTEGIVIDTHKFSRKVNQTEAEREKCREEIKEAEKKFVKDFARHLRGLLTALNEKMGGDAVEATSGEVLVYKRNYSIVELKSLRSRVALDNITVKGGAKAREEVARIIEEYNRRIDEAEDEKNSAITRLTKGDELPTGVLELVKVYVATKRILSVGDKMAGRHGNKGVIARILPAEDMPFLEDGTPVEIVLNPLGVPSRMNVGQILETHLGWAAKLLGLKVVSPIFDGCCEKDISDLLEKAGLPRDGKVTLYDGRTGESFEQKVTVGQIYMMKLAHLVEDKVHARATGPYSLITQQPLGGKARFGGQRFGEMEVWALEAYGAAHILQELLTVKSDDVDGRTKIYESMVKGENVLEPGTPVSFDVLCNEIRGLALDITLNKKKV